MVATFLTTYTHFFGFSCSRFQPFFFRYIIKYLTAAEFAAYPINLSHWTHGNEDVHQHLWSKCTVCIPEV